MKQVLRRLGFLALLLGTLFLVTFNDDPELFRGDSPLNPLDASLFQHVIQNTEQGNGKFVALTFDDGPNPVYTPQVLDILRQHHIHATFCLVGEQAQRYPDLVRQIVADGHRLCDHSMTHDENLPHRSDARIEQEIMGTLHLLNTISPGTPVYYFRPPGGALSLHEIDLVKSWGFATLYWSVDTRDWSRPGVNVILANVRRELTPGGVILMHDAGGDRSQTVQALKILIPQLIADGYKFDFPQH